MEIINLFKYCKHSKIIVYNGSGLFECLHSLLLPLLLPTCARIYKPYLERKNTKAELVVLVPGNVLIGYSDPKLATFCTMQIALFNKKLNHITLVLLLCERQRFLYCLIIQLLFMFKVPF